MASADSAFNATDTQGLQGRKGGTDAERLTELFEYTVPGIEAELGMIAMRLDNAIARIDGLQRKIEGR